MTKATDQLAAVKAQADRVRSKLELAERAVASAETAQAEALAKGDDKAVDAAIDKMSRAVAEVSALSRSIELAAEEVKRAEAAVKAEEIEVEKSRVVAVLKKASGDVTKAAPALEKLAAAAAEAFAALDNAIPPDLSPAVIIEEGQNASRARGNTETDRAYVIGALLAEALYHGAPSVAARNGFGRIALALCDLRDTKPLRNGRRATAPIEPKDAVAIFADRFKDRAAMIAEGRLVARLDRVEHVEQAVEADPSDPTASVRVFTVKPCSYVSPEPPYGKMLHSPGRWTTVERRIADALITAGCAYLEGTPEAAEAEEAEERRLKANPIPRTVVPWDSDIVDLGNPFNVPVSDAPGQSHSTAYDPALAGKSDGSALQRDHPLRTGEHLRH